MDRVVEKKTFYLKKKYWPAIISIIVILPMLLFLTNKRSLKISSDNLVVAEVIKGDFKEYVSTIGIVIPQSTYYLDAKEGGIVETIYVEEGAQLKQNEKILMLSNSGLQLNVLQQEAYMFEQINNFRNTRLLMEQNAIGLKNTLLNVNHELKGTEKTYNRAKILHEKNMISTEEFEKTEENYSYCVEQQKLANENWKKDSLIKFSQLKQLEESLSRINNNLSLVKKNLEDLTLKSPIEGVLTSFNFKIGQSISPGTRLGQIDGMADYRIHVSVDEFYISKIHLGLEAKIDQPESQSAELRVTKIYPEVKNGKIEVDLEFTNNKISLKRGQSLPINIYFSDATHSVLLQKGGYSQKTGGHWVYVVDKSGKRAKKRNIVLGRQNSDYFELKSGLNPGEKVVVSSYDNFDDMDELFLEN